MRNTILSLFFFIVFVYSVVPSPLFTISEQTSLFFAIFPALFALLLAMSNHISLLKRDFLYPIVILTIWALVLYVNSGIRPSPYPFCAFLTAYVVYKIWRQALITKIVDYLIAFSIIGLIIWLLNFIIGSLLSEIAIKINFPSYGNNIKAILFWCINPDGIRNPGCCWEPGRYSCFLVIGIYLHSLKNGFHWKKDWRLWILLLSLVTTMSTTGFGAFIIFLTLRQFSFQKTINPLHLIGTLLLIEVAWSLPFMSEKIMEWWIDSDMLDTKIGQLEWLAANRPSDSYFVPQRFEGFAYRWIDFLHMNFLTGDGHNFTKYYLNKNLGFMIAPSEGIIGVVLCYGIIIGFLIYLSLYKSSLYLSRLSTYSYKLPRMTFLILFIMMNFSYNFWELPIIIPLWLMSFFESFKENKITVQI